MNLDKSNVLVVGGAGHVGSHIVDELLLKNVSNIVVYDNLSNGRAGNLPNDYRIELIRGDIRDYDQLLLATEDIDYVFHTASLLLLESREYPEKAIDVNIKGTYNVLKASQKQRVKKIVFSSSASVYGDPVTLPVSEDHPFNSEIIYGTTKIAGEHLFRNFYKAYKTNFVGLRYYNIYGPRIHNKGSYTQIIPRWFDFIEHGIPLIINGDGSQTMDLIYVTDVAKANILAMESDVTNEFFNIGTGISTTVLDLAKIIMDITGYKKQVEFVNQDVNLVKRRQASIEKAKKLLGFTYEVEVHDGINEYYAWRKYLQNKNRNID